MYQHVVSGTPTNAQQQIEQAINEPARARDNAIEVQNRSVDELIKADKHLRGSHAAKSPFRAIKRAMIRFGSSGGI